MQAEVIAMVVVLAAVASAAMLLRRNNKVYRWRTRLLERISDAATADINNGIYDFNRLRARYDVLRSMNYTEQVLKFWRPLESWITPEVERALTPLPRPESATELDDMFEEVG
jgi:hypothetical protein